jgi:hypothetical protein
MMNIDSGYFDKRLSCLCRKQNQRATTSYTLCPARVTQQMASVERDERIVQAPQHTEVRVNVELPQISDYTSRQDEKEYIQTERILLLQSICARLEQCFRKKDPEFKKPQDSGGEEMDPTKAAHIFRSLREAIIDERMLKDDFTFHRTASRTVFDTPDDAIFSITFREDAAFYFFKSSEASCNCIQILFPHDLQIILRNNLTVEGKVWKSLTNAFEKVFAAEVDLGLNEPSHVLPKAAPKRGQMTKSAAKKTKPAQKST